MVCFAPLQFLLVYPCVDVGLQGLLAAAWPAPIPQPTTSLGPPAPTLLRVLSTQLPISVPPSGLDECFFFISLVVGLPYS